MRVVELGGLHGHAPPTSTAVVHQVVATTDVIEGLEENTLRGHGTIARGGELIASTCGVVERTNKLICVRTLEASRYQPEVGDVVGGTITPIGGSKALVDLHSKGAVQLQLSAVNLPGDVQRRRTTSDALTMRSILAESDLLSAEVQAVHSDGIVLLHTRSSRYGRLEHGQLVIVAAGLVKRQRQHIVEVQGCEVILGCNGMIWVGAKGDTKGDTGVGLDAASHAAIARTAEVIRGLAGMKRFITLDSINELMC